MIFGSNNLYLYMAVHRTDTEWQNSA